MRSRTVPRAPAAALAALAVTAVMPNAWGYCRATTCPSDGLSCTAVSDTCKPLRWERSCVGVALQQDASTAIGLDQLRPVISAAFAVWQQADCGGRTPGIVVQDLGDVSCGKVEYNKKAGNVNVLAFRDGGWPHPNSSHQLALTTVTFDPSTGEIYNADIEVNSADYNFTDVASLPDETDLVAQRLDDLLAVLTHETGHFLGLAHSPDPESTMFASYSNGTKFDALKFRSLEVDDVQGICTVYPPADIDLATCNPIPRHGFASECSDEQPTGCSVRARGATVDLTHAALLGGLALAAMRLRRRGVTRS